MRVAALVVLFLLRAHAAVVMGVVLDDETGNPLARTQVSLVPLPGTDAANLTIRSGERGAFTMLNVRQGWYILRTTRRGFAVTEAGQMRPGRPGLPFEVTSEDRSTFFQLRMRRLAAVTGTVFDENGVGIPDWPVHVYLARKPVRRVAEGITDDRGNFRVGGLDPGGYLVRSGAGNLEDDTQLLPTYYKYGVAVETAEAVRLRLGETQQDVAIRPVKGKLLEIAGVLTGPGDRAVRLTLITDTGRRVIASLAAGIQYMPFSAAGVAPGQIELLAEGPECGGYNRQTIERDTAGLRVACGPLQKPVIDWRGGETMKTPYTLTMRRVDLDGTGMAKELRPDEPPVPGHWELMAQTGAAHYVTGMRSSFSGGVAVRSDGWFGLDLPNAMRLQITLSPRPASVSGVVSSGGKPVVGAAVYLEMFNPELAEARLLLLTARSDEAGKYRFAGLTPGRYRILSSFDFDAEDRFAMDRAAAMTLRESDAVVQALELVVP